jgi:hypothetical protein
MDWRKLHNEELHNLCISPDIIRMIKLRSIGWVSHVALMVEIRNTRAYPKVSGLAACSENCK